ncbi:hypothetical protein Hdeb2414_s0033g00721611 [Helianthus debilis subsp. tardiflorus]
MVFDGHFLCSCLDSESGKFVAGLKILRFLHMLGLKIYLFVESNQWVLMYDGRLEYQIWRLDYQL